MKVILNQDVVNLGEEGDIREVAKGYARNYLIPRKMAVTYTKQNLALFEGRKNAIEKRKEEKRQEALGLKERLEAVELKLIMPAGENGKLFGSVTNATIVDELQKQGITIERRKVELPEHALKTQGRYKARVRLYDNQEALVTVDINPKEG